MEITNFSRSLEELNKLKQESQEMQKKGLPFMMASVVIWTLILLVQFMKKELITINLYTFMCSCLLLPLVYVFSKLIKADSFKKTENPICKLGFLCTMNQMLYLLIVMWAFNQKPEAMLMLYTMVFGAHLFPYSWVYDSRAYLVISVLDTIGALIIAQIWGNIATAIFMIITQLLLCILLFTEMRKGKRPIES